MAGIAGSVAPVFRGEYNASNTYDFYHSVTYGNKLYFCKQDGTKGHTPTGATDDNWFLSLDGTFADAASLGGETALQWQRKINVEKARIDQLIAMEEGKIVTDVEKELADIRVGSNGVTYEDAGTAVREQMAVRNVATTKVSELPNVKLPLDEVLEGIDAKTDEAFKAMEEKAEATIATIPSDYTALSNEVTGVKSDLCMFGDNLHKVVKDTMIIETGKNICPPTLYDGYLNSDGSLTVELDWKSTDFIYVGDCENVVYSITQINNGERIYGHSMWFLTTYDANKTVIEQPSGVVNTYTVGDNVAYIRFSVHSDSYHELMVEKGTSATEYEEYYSVYRTTGKWRGKKWACIGDSLTEHNSRSSKNYDDYIAEKTGIEVVNMGRSGTGYARTQDEGFAFYQRVSNVPTDCDVVTIFGSFNDLGAGLPIGDITDGYEDTICGCINKTIDNLYAIIPTVQLGIVAPTPWINTNPYTNTDTEGNNYVTALKNICERRNIPFLDLYHCSNLRPWDETFRTLAYSKDEGNGVHPNEKGHKLIAPRFKAFLESLLM